MLDQTKHYATAHVAKHKLELHLNYFMMMRLLLFLMLLAVSLVVEGQEVVCNVSGTTLTSQAAVDQFGNRPGCDSIVVLGDLMIGDRFTASDISDLVALSKIAEVRGRFVISNSPDLLSLNGLQGLRKISGSRSELSISNCDELTSLVGLSSLIEVGKVPYHPSDGISISDCPKFESLGVALAMTRLNSFLVTDCPMFNSFGGLESLEQIDRTLQVTNVASGTNFNGLNSLRVIGALDLRFSSVNSLVGLTAIDSVSSISIQDNTSLQNLDGLETLRTADLMTIINTPVTDISGISGLERVQTFAIQQNNFLVSLDLPDQLDFNIIRIQSNPVLAQINQSGMMMGFPNPDNGSFSEFNLSINDVLEDLSGLTGELSVDRLTIFLNPMLATCEVPMLCSFIEDGGTPTVNNNAPGCNTFQEIEAACLALPVTWQAFTATGTDKGVQLNWSTVSEENNAGYAVEHSLDGIAFSSPPLHLRPRPANQGGTHAYDWFYPTTLGGTHYFRIRQEDYDGTVSYSAIRQVTLAGEAAVRVYPTVVRDYVTVESSLPKTTIRLLTSAGHVVQTHQLEQGVHQLPLGDLPPSIYLLIDGAGGLHRLVR